MDALKDPNLSIDEIKLLNGLRGIQRIVINTCHGGFSLSKQACEMYENLAGITDKDWYDRNVARDDPHLVEVVEKLGAAANGRFAELKVVDVPSDVEWQIDEYDGAEWVAEVHRTWC